MEVPGSSCPVTFLSSALFTYIEERTEDHAGPMQRAAAGPKKGG